jgi:hypothetical protein
MAAARVDKIYTCDMFHPSSRLLEQHATKDGRHICVNTLQRSPQMQTSFRTIGKLLEEIETCEDA